MHNLSIIFMPTDINHSSLSSALLNYMLICSEGCHISSAMKISLTGCLWSQAFIYMIIL